MAEGYILSDKDGLMDIGPYVRVYPDWSGCG